MSITGLRHPSWQGQVWGRDEEKFESPSSQCNFHYLQYSSFSLLYIFIWPIFAKVLCFPEESLIWETVFCVSYRCIIMRMKQNQLVHVLFLSLGVKGEHWKCLLTVCYCIVQCTSSFVTDTPDTWVSWPMHIIFASLPAVLVRFFSLDSFKY